MVPHLLLGDHLESDLTLDRNLLAPLAALLSAASVASQPNSPLWLGKHCLPICKSCHATLAWNSSSLHWYKAKEKKKRVDFGKSRIYMCNWKANAHPHMLINTINPFTYRSVSGWNGWAQWPLLRQQLVVFLEILLHLKLKCLVNRVVKYCVL